jgi:hypothetical protein
MVTRGKATEVETAYLAGVVDGEGCIGFHLCSNKFNRRINPIFAPEVTVVNSNRELLEWLQARFGGRLNTRKREKEHHKQTWCWRVGNRQAYEVCRLIAPLLICKRVQAEAIVEFYEKAPPRPMGRGAETTPEEVQRRISLYERCRGLNDSRHPQRLNEKAPIPIWEKRQSELRGNPETAAETAAALA